MRTLYEAMILLSATCVAGVATVAVSGNTHGRVEPKAPAVVQKAKPTGRAAVQVAPGLRTPKRSTNPVPGHPAKG
jgi:hypothetical protein